MGRIWSDQRRYETWLLVETAAAEAMAAAGIVPAEAARDIRERGAFEIARIEEIERTTQHDVIAFTTAVAEKMAAAGQAEASRWLHYGLTSNDIVDTAQALLIRHAIVERAARPHAPAEIRGRDRQRGDVGDQDGARRRLIRSILRMCRVLSDDELCTLAEYVLLITI